VVVAGSAGVPPGAHAVVFNVTATEAVAPGFVQVLPTDGVAGSTSTLNVQRAGQTIPNAALASLGALGDLSVFSQSGTHLLLDVFGYVTAPVP
jgi:hypothetical protein